jgi:hypothetical protein
LAIPGNAAGKLKKIPFRSKIWGGGISQVLKGVQN